MLQNAVRSDQRIAIYNILDKSYLIVFIIIVKAGVVWTKTDWNAMNLTRLYKERKKERKKGEWQKKKKKKEQIPDFVSGIGALSLEIRTGNCLSQLPCRHPYNHLAVLGRLNQKWQNRTESVCAELLFVIPACETKICTKNSNILHLWLVQIGDHVGRVDGSMRPTSP